MLARVLMTSFAEFIEYVLRMTHTPMIWLIALWTASTGLVAVALTYRSTPSCPIILTVAAGIPDSPVVACSPVI